MNLAMQMRRTRPSTIFASGETNVELSTIIGCASMLGSSQEDRGAIRRRQNPELLDLYREVSYTSVRSKALDGFIVSPFDIMVEDQGDQPTFHILEFNGTGIGGLTNLPIGVLENVGLELAEQIRQLPGKAPLILVATSGLEDPDAPRKNKLIYEKIVYVEFMRRQLVKKYGSCATVSAEDFSELPQELVQPTIVLGYMKPMLECIQLDSKRRICFRGRTVDCIVNDRFALNVLMLLDLQDLPAETIVLNRSFMAGADKTTAYLLMQRFGHTRRLASFTNLADYSSANDMESLISQIQDRLQRRRTTVIKPSGTGLGHGIEFFLDFDESPEEITRRLELSVEQTSRFYGLKRGAFPYAICPYINSRVIAPPHRLAGHRFELRVVVLRHDDGLIAIPSIAKVSPTAFDVNQIERSMLINNISTSTHETAIDGKNFILPLANYETLEILGLTVDQVTLLSQDCAALMAYSLDDLERQAEAKRQ